MIHPRHFALVALFVVATSFRSLPVMGDNTDVTSLLTNPDFSDGWTGWFHYSYYGGAMNANADAKCAEAWNCDGFNMYQTVADAPTGAYKLTVQGFYRYNRGDASWQAYFNEDGTRKEFNPEISYVNEAPVYVYLNDKYTPLMDVYQYPVTYGQLYSSSGAYADPKGQYWYPNDMATAGQAFDMGAYTISSIGVVTADSRAENQDVGELLVGVSGSTNQANDSWAIFTRFKLTYIGYDVDVLRPVVENEIDNLTALYDNAYCKDLKADKSSLTIARNCLGSSDGKWMVSVIGMLQNEIEVIKQSMEVFDKLLNAINNLNEAIDNSKASAATLSEANDLRTRALAGWGGEYTNDDAIDAISEIEYMIKRLSVPANLGSDDNPADFTSVIVDADFEDLTVELSKYGAWTWTKNGGNGPMFPMGGSTSTAFEFWVPDAASMAFSVSQTITGLPAGKYKLTADLANSYNGVESAGNDGRAYLFAEVEGNSRIPSVPVEPKEEDATEYDTYSIIFSVPEDFTPVTIGVKTVGAMDARWFSGDNFTLTSYGSNSVLKDSPDKMNGEEDEPVTLTRPDIMWNGEHFVVMSREEGAVMTITLNDEVIKNTREMEVWLPVDSLMRVAYGDELIDRFTLAAYVSAGGVQSETFTAQLPSYSRWRKDHYGRDVLDAFTYENNQLAYAIWWNMTADKGLYRLGIHGLVNGDGDFAAINNYAPAVADFTHAIFIGSQVVTFDNPNLSAIIWNEQPIDTLSTTNPNLLFFCSDASIAPSNIHNVVIDNVAEDIMLDADSPFECPQDFTAKRITYKRTMTMQSGKGYAEGWETLVLPFDVQDIYNSTKQTAIVPFALYEPAVPGEDEELPDVWPRPFWLYELSFEPKVAEEIKAYNLYLLSMPNNANYFDHFNIPGEITFTSTDVTVPDTRLIGYVSSDMTIAPSIRNYAANDNIYALNTYTIVEKDGVEYKPGSAFISGAKAVKPFEVYILKNNTQAKAIPVRSLLDNAADGIEEIEMSRRYSEHDGATYNLQGVRVNNSDAKRKGIYIVNGRKVVVK